MRNDNIFNTGQNLNFEKFVYQIDKKSYYFRATLINPDGSITDLKKGAIKELKIIDNLFNPFTNGYIVIDDTNNALERYVEDPISNEFTPSNRPFVGYNVRGDNRDIILLNIFPLIYKDKSYIQPPEAFLKFSSYKISYFLSNETTVIKDGISCKKYDLIDMDEALLKSTKLFFSSTSLLDSKNVCDLTNNERSINTGTIIKGILKQGLGGDDIVASETKTVDGVVTKVDVNFEKGSSNLFYSSPADNSAYDDLMYVYNLHVSSESIQDFAFLNKDNYTGEYTLEGCTSVFSKAYKNNEGGEYFLETLTLGGGQDVNSLVQNESKSPANTVKLGEMGDIIQAKFFNTSGNDIENKIRSILVHSYNFYNKSFLIDSFDGNIENIKKDFTKSYVSTMKGKQDNPAPNFIITNNKKQNYNYENVFTIYNLDDDFIKLAVGKNKILRNALTLNLGVEIIVEGGLHRHAGKFFSIDRTESYIDNKFDNKFLGIYIILEVHQYFDNDNIYRNKIIGVKTYHYEDPKFNENVV